MPRVPGIAGTMTRWSVEIARVTPSRLTLRFTFDKGVTVYAKAYREILERGRMPGRLLCGRRNSGKTCRYPPRLGRPKWAGSISTNRALRRVAEAVLGVIDGTDRVHGFRPGAEGAHDER